MPSWSFDFQYLKLPVFFVIGLSFLIDKLPPCLSKQFLGKLLSQALDHKLYEILLLFIKGFQHNRNLLFLLFCTLHGSGWERDNYICRYVFLKARQSHVHMWVLFLYTVTFFICSFIQATDLLLKLIRSILTATAMAAFSGYIGEHWPANIRKLCITIVTLKKFSKRLSKPSLVLSDSSPTLKGNVSAILSKDLTFQQNRVLSASSQK